MFNDKYSLDKLKRMLQGSDFTVRLEAISQLEQVATDKDVAKLVDLLATIDDPMVQGALITTLDKIKHPHAQAAMEAYGMVGNTMGRVQTGTAEGKKISARFDAYDIASLRAVAAQFDYSDTDALKFCVLWTAFTLFQGEHGG